MWSYRHPTRRSIKDDARFIGASVRREFQDITLNGTIISHVKPVEADLSDEKWIVEYTNGKQQAVSPQELLDLLVGEPVQAPKTKAKKATIKQPNPTPKPKLPEPLIGRQNAHGWTCRVARKLR
jgi:hypothetical protein